MRDTNCLLERTHRKRPFSWRAMMTIASFSSSGRLMLRLLYSPRAFACRRIKHSFTTTSLTFRSFEKMTTTFRLSTLSAKRCLIHDEHSAAATDVVVHSHSSEDTTYPPRLNDLTGLTVKEAMEYSIVFLQEAGAPEPEMSVSQLLASALDLPWSNGFLLLRDVMQSPHANANQPLATRILTRTEANAVPRVSCSSSQARTTAVHSRQVGLFRLQLSRFNHHYYVLVLKRKNWYCWL